jgi:hypothetical protein
MHVHVDDREAWFFPLAVANGVTGLRDMGSTFAQLRRWRSLAEMEPAVPRIVASGPILTGLVRDDDPRIVRIGTAAEAERAVDAHAEAGADFVKVHDWLSPEAYRAILHRSASRRLPVAGHLPVAIDAAEAAAGGQRSLEHLGNAWGGLLLDCSTEGAPLRAELRALVGKEFSLGDVFASLTRPERVARIADAYSPARAEALARVLAQSGTYQTPTLYSSSFLPFAANRDDLLRDPRHSDLPASVREDLPGMLGDLVPAVRDERLTRFRARQLELVRVLTAAGVPFLAGTDTAPGMPVFPGFSLHDELAQLVAAGLTPMEALRAATLAPARYLGEEERAGSVAAGKLADLVVLEADPLTDIRNVGKVHAVVLRGRYFGPDERRRLLDKARETPAPP